MTTPSLLNIDPDKLFEQSSILEIENVQKKLQNEIERKREELRTMVGERYRDLIEAADTIYLMKQLSEKVICDVDKMKVATAELQQKQVSGFKVDYRYHPKDKTNTWAGVAAQIKVIVDVAEYIWEAVDQADYTKATLLFLMARFIKTRLEMNPSFKTTKYFPVVSRQWSSLVHFKDTILHGAEKTLKTQHGSEVCCRGLVSLTLLEGLTATQLLAHYLALRSEALKTVLSTSQSMDSATIKDRLYQSYSLLIHTIVAVYHCFLEQVSGKEGLLWQELQSHVGSQSPPTILLLDPESCDVPTALLPSSVREFRPVLNLPMEPLPRTEVLKALSDWLVWVKAYVKEQGCQLLHRLSSLRSLQGLRDPPQEICEEWPLVAQKVELLPNMDLWNELYRSLITVRAQELVTVHWDSAFKALQLQIRTAFESASMENKQTEVDLLWYMWKESTTDLKNPNDPKCNKGLWLKSKGVTPRVAELCALLETKVNSLLGDLASLCPDQELDPALLYISHTLKAHQQTVCSNLVVRLVEYVRQTVTEATNESGVMLLAKFLQSVPELCPSLSKCLSSVDSKSVSCQALIQSDCQLAYKAWLSLASVRVLKLVTEALGPAIPHIHSIPQWEEITIEEEGEAGEKLQSTLKVPCNVSLNLQSGLHHLASVVGRAAIPKQICEQLVNSVLKSIIEIYNKNIDTNLTQTQYLQMLLDVKYLAQIFSASIDKELKAQFQDTTSSLESKIDPFDLNVFTPYINDNVKITVHRTQALYGVTGGMTVPVTSQRSEEPSVLALSTASTTWFPLLHITAPRTTNPSAKPKSKKSSSVANTSSELSAKQSTATSFFGAMATDWFG